MSVELFVTITNIGLGVTTVLEESYGVYATDREAIQACRYLSMHRLVIGFRLVRSDGTTYNSLEKEI